MSSKETKTSKSPSYYAKGKLVRFEKVRRVLNKARISRIRTFIKKFYSSVKNQTNVLESFRDAQSEIMRGVSKGVMKKNTASRKVSRLCKVLAKSTVTEMNTTVADK